MMNNNIYQIIKLLGHGKGGYSYLAKGPNGFVVLKRIHHEPCNYYQFGDKFDSEIRDYQRLVTAKIRVPKLIDSDNDSETIVKEYIEGKTIFEMIKEDIDVSMYLPQIREMALLAKQAGLNIDYFPTNFVVNNGLLYYIDYECNEYMDEWNFDNWGQKYWSKSPEFIKYIDS